VPPHRVLAINRGDKEGPLKIKLEVPRPDLEAAFFHQLPLEGHPQGDFFRTAALDALDRLILPSMEREVRRDLTEAAEKHAVEVFARNLRSLLLQPPIPKQVVLAIDPGLRSGCKVSVLDPQGNLLDHAVVYPHVPQNRRSEAKLLLKDLVGKHKVGVVAIGNGTACRETEELIAEIIAEGIEFSQAGLTPSSSVTSMPAGEHERPWPHSIAPEYDHPAAPIEYHHPAHAEEHHEHAEEHHEHPGHGEQHPAHAEHYSAAAEVAPGTDQVPKSPDHAGAEGPAHHEPETPGPANASGDEAPQPASLAAAEPASTSEGPDHQPPDRELASDEADPAAEAEPELEHHPEENDPLGETPTEEEVLPPILGGAPEPASPEADTDSEEGPGSDSDLVTMPPHNHEPEVATTPPHNHEPRAEHHAAGSDSGPDVPSPQKFVVPDEPEDPDETGDPDEPGDMDEPGEPAPHSELDSSSPLPSTVAAVTEPGVEQVEPSAHGIEPAAAVEGFAADETAASAGAHMPGEMHEPTEEPSPAEVPPSDAGAEPTAPSAPGDNVSVTAGGAPEGTANAGVPLKRAVPAVPSPVTRATTAAALRYSMVEVCQLMGGTGAPP